MSYRRAWQLLVSLNSCFRTPAQERASVIARLARDRRVNSVQPLNEWLYCDVPRSKQPGTHTGLWDGGRHAILGARLWSGATGATRYAAWQIGVAARQLAIDDYRRDCSRRSGL